jgi:hypothetical protein
MQSGLISTLEAMEASYGLPTGHKRPCIADLYSPARVGNTCRGIWGGGERPPWLGPVATRPPDHRV